MAPSLNLDEIKSLITFCRSERVQRVTVGQVSVTFSSFAAVESIPASEPTLEESEDQRVKRERQYMETLLDAVR